MVEENAKWSPREPRVGFRHLVRKDRLRRAQLLQRQRQGWAGAREGNGQRKVGFDGVNVAL